MGLASARRRHRAIRPLRAGIVKFVDEAFIEVIAGDGGNGAASFRREQFGSRGIFDNPMLPGSPRTLTVFGQQLFNYLEYFTWQWGRSLLPAARLIAFIVFLVLGSVGFEFARRRDRGVAYLLGTLWLVTGLGLVIYMNFKAGFSRFWDMYPSWDQHEVRERDYFFVVSFKVWGVFAAFGLVLLVQWLSKVASRRIGIAVASFLALVPFAANFSAASRRHGPDATVARDFAYNLVQSVEPYGVLFAYGDNDTFPVWYLQEVEGIRQDVTLINLSLANLDWYMSQLASRPTRQFDPAHAPAIYRTLAPTAPPSGPIVRMTPEDIAGMRPMQVSEDAGFRAGTFELPVRKGQALRTSDLVIFTTIAQDLATRPITFGVSSGRGSWLGLDPHLVFQGLVFRVAPRADTTRRFLRGVQGTMVDSTRTHLLVDSVFSWGKLFEPDTLVLEPAAQQVATSFSVPFLELGNAAVLRGDQRQALYYLRRSYHLSPNKALAGIIHRIETEGVQSLFRR